MILNANITMTRAQAERFDKGLERSRMILVQRIKVIRRKRSWLAAARAMAEAEERMALDQIIALQSLICQHFNMRGE